MTPKNQPDPQDMWDAIDALVERREELHLQLQLVESRLEAAVRHLVLEDHATWEQIGGALGVSRQAAHERYHVRIYGVQQRLSP